MLRIRPAFQLLRKRMNVRPGLRTLQRGIAVGNVSSDDGSPWLCRCQPRPGPGSPDNLHIETAIAPTRGLGATVPPSPIYVSSTRHKTVEDRLFSRASSNLPKRLETGSISSQRSARFRSAEIVSPILPRGLLDPCSIYTWTVIASCNARELTWRADKLKDPGGVGCPTAPGN